MCSCFSLVYSKVVLSLSFEYQLDFISPHIWSTPPLAKDHCCVHEEKQNVPAPKFKVLATEKSTKAVSCFCSFTYCKVMVITKGGCGEGVETHVNGKCGSGAVSSTRGEGREERAV